MGHGTKTDQHDGEKMNEPQTFERRQGNSLWIKIKCRKWADIDPTWGNFAGTWKLMTSAGVDVVGVSGAITPSSTAGEMFIKITPAMTLPLAVGDYILVSEVTNSAQSYKEERQDTLSITGTSAI